MYGIGDKNSCNLLIDKELIQICIGLYHLILKFADNLAISAECELCLKYPDGSEIKILDHEPVNFACLTCLLGRVVENVKVEDDEELSLFFSGGFQLSIFDSNKSEESFTISMNGYEMVV